VSSGKNETRESDGTGEKKKRDHKSEWETIRERESDM
jgi:hypothetical protein